MNLCYLCHQPLRYDLRLANEYALACNNYECCGKVNGVSFNYRVQDGEVTHYFLPLFYNNKLYSTVSSQQQFGTNTPNTTIEYYPNIYSDFEAQVLVEIPKFYPTTEHTLSSHAFNMINRLFKLKAFS